MQLYSQLDKHVSRLAASAVIDDRSCRSGREQEIEDGLAASRAPNESRPRRLRRPMCLVLPKSSVIIRYFPSVRTEIYTHIYAIFRQ